MKTSTIYKYLLFSTLFLISTVAQAQCPFTASITTMDAGGCGNSNGSVYFTVQEAAAGSIAGKFFLVYKSDGTTLLTSPTNINAEVSLAAGDYVAEIVVQCTDNNPQASWRKDFTIKQTAESKNFKGAFFAADSRITTLNAYPSGMLAYKFSGAGEPYILDIIEYPSEYTGPVHFENIPNGIFKIDKLAAGNYKVRMTNGCMTTTDGARTIIKTPIDIPLENAYSIFSRMTVLNTQGGEIYQERPTTDYSTVYFQAQGLSEPYDYWGRSVSAEFYEYAWIVAEDGEVINDQTIWRDLDGSNIGNPYNKIDSKYTAIEMFNSRDADGKGDPKTPTLYVRLKKTNQMIKHKFTIARGISSSDDYTTKLSALDCDRLDIDVSLWNRTILTYPLKIELRARDAASTLLATHTVTEEDMKLNYITFTNVDVSLGYNAHFITTSGINMISSGGSGSTLDQKIVISASRYKLANTCESDLTYIYIGGGNNSLDLKGAKVKYTGTIPLPSNIVQEFTVPTDATQLYLTTRTEDKPWSGYSYHVAPLPAGVYTWDISMPCGPSGYTTYTKSITLTDPKQPQIVNPANFKPKTVLSTTCGFVEIEIGNFTELANIFKTYNGNTTTSSFMLCHLVEPSTASGRGKYLGNYYQTLNNAWGVYYDGGDSDSFTTTPSNAVFVKPKIRISRPGTYYLVATEGSYSSQIQTSAPCVLIEKFVISDGDFEPKIDMNTTGAYYCAQDMSSSGVIFIQREGINTGNEFIFRVWNDNLSYDNSVTTAEIQVSFNDIDVKLHGTRFNISVEPVGNCSTTPAVATLELNAISNSATFITQNIESDCNGAVDITVTGNAYIGASYKWKDSDGNELSNTNELHGNFATGTKLKLEVVFTSQGPGGIVVPCSTWIKEYTVTGLEFTEFYWKNNAVDNNWNNWQNWNKKDGTQAHTVPSVCSEVHIPATVKSFYPDLGQATPVARATHVYFEFGGQLYNQHKLIYGDAFISYDFGYYQNLTSPAPTTIVQPAHSVAEVTASATNKTPIAFSTLPAMSRARWYMLAAPIKGMFMGDFQLAGKPFMVQRTYKNIAPTVDVLVQDGFAVSYASDQPLSSTYNSLSLWAPPHGKAIGAENQEVLEALKGVIKYPYFNPYLIDEAILDARLDVTFDKMTRIQGFKQFELATLELSSAKTVTRLDNSGRFVYEEDATNAIPADNTYSLTIAADDQRANGEVMIGNPYMAPIDFDKFVAANAGVIKTSYKIIVDGVGKTYDQSNPAAPNSLGNFIAAQQSFIIILSSPTAATTIKFPVAATATQAPNTISVKVL